MLYPLSYSGIVLAVVETSLRKGEGLWHTASSCAPWQSRTAQPGFGSLVLDPLEKAMRTHFVR